MAQPVLFVQAVLMVLSAAVSLGHLRGNMLNKRGENSPSPSTWKDVKCELTSIMQIYRVTFIYGRRDFDRGRVFVSCWSPSAPSVWDTSRIVTGVILNIAQKINK